MTVSIQVTWTKSIVDISGVTKYRLVTACATPVGISDAKLFLIGRTGTVDSYLHVCTIGDMLYYYPIATPGNPPPRKITVGDPGFVAPTLPGDLGKPTAGTLCVGSLISVDTSDTHKWVVAPTSSSDVYTVGATIAVTGGTGAGVISASAAETKFRVHTISQDFDTPQAALDAESLQRTRITNLITDWSNDYNTYPGTDTETISEP